MSNKIYIPIKKKEPNRQGVVKIIPEAMEAVTRISNKTGLSVRQVVSMIIMHVVENNLIEFIRED